MSADDDPQSVPIDRRLTAIEEHAAFSERAVEELAEEVRLLNARVRELGQRLAAAEARVIKMESGTPDPAEPTDEE